MHLEIWRNIAAKDFVYNDSTAIKLTVTVGKADYQSGRTLNERFSMADDRLYAGKQAGKNRVVDF